MMKKKLIFIIPLVLSILCLSLINSSIANEIDNDFEQTELLEDIIMKIKEEYIGNIDNKAIIENALNGILSNLDQYSGYLNSQTFTEIQIQTKGEFGGIGVEINQHNNKVKVSSVIKNTPADKFGIKAGDYIVKVNDQDIDHLSLSEISNKLRGSIGSEVKLKIVSKNKEKIVNIRRSSIKIQSIDITKIEDIAYIKISSFNGNTTDSLKMMWKDLNEKHKFKGILLDLRNNKGGLLSQAVEVCDAFLDNGNIVSIRGKNNKNNKLYVAHNGDMFKKIPVVVLINNNSASASEIVAGALQDHKRALIVGTKSFGKGSVQTIIPIKGGGAIRITNALYYTPLNNLIHEKGIVPDVYLNKSDRTNKCNITMNERYKKAIDENDCQLIDAINILQKIISTKLLKA